jgi:hypothetical protein
MKKQAPARFTFFPPVFTLFLFLSMALVVSCDNGEGIWSSRKDKKVEKIESLISESNRNYEQLINFIQKIQEDAVYEQLQRIVCNTYRIYLLKSDAVKVHMMDSNLEIDRFLDSLERIVASNDQDFIVLEKNWNEGEMLVRCIVPTSLPYGKISRTIADYRNERYRLEPDLITGCNWPHNEPLPNYINARKIQQKGLAEEIVWDLKRLKKYTAILPELERAASFNMYIILKEKAFNKNRKNNMIGTEEALREIQEVHKLIQKAGGIIRKAKDRLVENKRGTAPAETNEILDMIRI